MLLFILLTVKFLLFQYFTKIISAPWLVFAMDMVFLSIYYLIARRKDKVSTIISLVIYSVISFIIFADIVYFTYFNRLPSIYELGHAGVLTDVTDAIFVLIRWHDYLFILDIPVLIFLAYKNKLHLIDQFIEDKLKKFYQYIPYAMLLISVLIIAIGHNRINEVRDMQLFTYHARDILGLRHENYSDLDLQGNYEKSSNTPNEWTGIAKGKNLFIIQVESLNNFVINREYNGHEITPVMNKLIEENGTIYADDYFELLGAGNTSDAEFVSLHSLYPSIKNPSYEVYKDKYVFGLPKILTENGYKNTAFHNYKRDFWIRDTAYPHIGFERFIAEDNYELDDIIAMGLSDKSFFRQSMPYILDMDRPIFAFLVTLTSHIPYEMPDEDIVIPIKPKDQGSIFGNYMNSIHYTDAAIGEFIDDLKKHNLYDDSVIVI
ncbi:MAG: LTA synthase family protein, partial [Tissierellia bacterium]|nr:LTA synthase family protein [Tissierellia bacterium]